jgi:hypothetical protein
VLALLSCTRSTVPANLSCISGSRCLKAQHLHALRKVRMVTVLHLINPYWQVPLCRREKWAGPEGRWWHGLEREVLAVKG